MWMSRLTTAGWMVSAQIWPFIGEIVLNKGSRPPMLVGCGSGLACTIEEKRSPGISMSPLTSKQLKLVCACIVYVCVGRLQTRNLGQHNLATDGVQLSIKSVPTVLIRGLFRETYRWAIRSPPIMPAAYLII